MRNRTVQNKTRLTFRFRLGLVFLLILAFLFSGLFLYRVLSIDSDFVTLAVAKNAGDLEVAVFDFSKRTVIKIHIPAETSVNLAMHRGTLRAQSIWKLVESEGLPGQILADTVTKTFHFPVDHWADESATKSLVAGKTDLPSPLRVRIFLMKIQRTEEESIDLSKTSYLSKGKLADGEEGYEVRGSLPLSLATLFADSRISEKQTAVSLINKTGKDQKELRDVVDVLGVLGAKVAPVVESEEDKDLSCEVSALNFEVAEKISSIFDCKLNPKTPEVFDIEITLGKKFYERF